MEAEWSTIRNEFLSEIPEDTQDPIQKVKWDLLWKPFYYSFLMRYPQPMNDTDMEIEGEANNGELLESMGIQQTDGMVDQIDFDMLINETQNEDDISSTIEQLLTVLQPEQSQTKSADDDGMLNSNKDGMLNSNKDVESGNYEETMDECEQTTVNYKNMPVLDVDTDTKMIDAEKAKEMPMYEVKISYIEKQKPKIKIKHAMPKWQSKARSYSDATIQPPSRKKFSFCNSSFSTISNLNKHIREKHQEGWPSISKLVKHAKVAHPKKENTLPSKKTNRAPVFNPVHEESMLHCHICQRSFQNLSNYRRHKSTVHDVSYPFKCGQCNFATSRKDSLKRHMTLIHN